jgi:hypothetical protein
MSTVIVLIFFFWILSSNDAPLGGSAEWRFVLPKICRHHLECGCWVDSLAVSLLKAAQCLLFSEILKKFSMLCMHLATIAPQGQ